MTPAATARVRMCTLARSAKLSTCAADFDEIGGWGELTASAATANHVLRPRKKSKRRDSRFASGIDPAKICFSALKRKNFLAPSATHTSSRKRLSSWLSVATNYTVQPRAPPCSIVLESLRNATCLRKVFEHWHHLRDERDTDLPRAMS